MVDAWAALPSHTHDSVATETVHVANTIVATAAELCAQYFQRQGFEPAGAFAPATGADPAAELLVLSRELLRLSRSHAPSVSIGSEGLVAPALGFLWALLPPFLEKPKVIAALAAVARGPSRALHDSGGLLVGHLHLHPNSLGRIGERPKFSRGSPTLSILNASAGGCFSSISLGALVSIAFHLPKLCDALWLLETMAQSSCHSLRKIVDRQSRWRPREERFDNLDDTTCERAADLADDLGRSLSNLRHLEGPIFSLLLRARGARAVSAGRRAEAIGTSGSASSSAPSTPRMGGATATSTSPARASPQRSIEQCSELGLPDVAPQGLGGRAETLHLVDACAGDLRGLWEPMCSRLQKLVLLNLPAAQPGRTAMAVTEFLPRAPNLTDLQLDFQFFDPTTWDFDTLEALVARVQAAPSKVNKFIMEWCRLGDAGARCVCRALAQNAREPGSTDQGVTELSLAHCELRDVSSICDMLEGPGLALTKLDLSSNALDDFQAERLAKALPSSKVKELRLRDSQISVPLPVRTEWFWGC